jgi:hypothetical protein
MAHEQSDHMQLIPFGLFSSTSMFVLGLVAFCVANPSFRFVLETKSVGRESGEWHWTPIG